jgi:pimeloyl-ACP methyl ester carboxylesterase
VVAAVYEDPPLFASEVNPAFGQSIGQAIGPLFALWHKWLGPQWTIGDVEGMRRAMGTELPPWMAAALQQMTGADNAERAGGLPQNLREYDPEWGDAFVSGRANLTCDHQNMLSHVQVPVLFTHHFRHVDPDTGHLMGASSDLQAAQVRQLVEATGNAFTYRSFPEMPHSMHENAPDTFVAAVTEWLASLSGTDSAA